MKKLLLILLLLIASALPHPLFPSRALSADAEPPYSFITEWSKLSAVDARYILGDVDKNILLAVLWLNPAPGYHTYSDKPGDEGTPLVVKALSNGEAISEQAVRILYVPGEKKSDEFGGTSYVYDQPTPVFILFPEKESRSVTLDVSLLACSDKHCRPFHGQILLPVAPEELKNAAQMPWFSQLINVSLHSSGSPADQTTFSPSATDGKIALHSDMLPEANTSIFHKSPQNASVAYTASSSQEDERQVNKGYALQPRVLLGSFRIDGWLRALGIGIIAGLLLNFMPCVLPVLTMKFSVLLEAGSVEERRKSIRIHNIFFACGIVTWFVMLAVVTGLTGMLWGQLFQSSEAIFFMLLIVFCMGLSMFDIFHLPVLDLQPQHSRSPKMQAFSTGIFTTLLATPCSGPLLGGVLAWGITKPLPVLMTVFVATGIGMSLPYIVIACFPRLVYFLPRPGAWFSALERILGLFLMGTAIYLFSLLPPSLHVKTLITLLVASTFAWIWGRWGSLRGSITRRMFLGTFSVGAIFLCAFWAFLPAQAEIVPWTAFSEKTFNENLGKKPMILEFTADWCPTCKVLERTTLSAPNLLPIIEQYSLTAIKVDMTKKNEAQEALLKSLNSASIPLLAVFPEGSSATSPVILRDIYSVTDLHLALRQAKIPHKRMVERLNPVKLLSQPKE